MKDQKRALKKAYINKREVMKPHIVKRIGNRFDIDERSILPYLRKKKDYILSAVQIACTEFKLRPDKYKDLTQQQKLQKLNDTVYDILKEWGIYKEREKT